MLISQSILEEAPQNLLDRVIEERRKSNKKKIDQMTSKLIFKGIFKNIDLQIPFNIEDPKTKISSMSISSIISYKRIDTVPNSIEDATVTLNQIKF